ncbi:hypothetical protein [Spongiactinospora gelatinilytica]|nr:hypothetical protein [Spongiactinospora gelatinilytica]
MRLTAGAGILAAALAGPVIMPGALAEALALDAPADDGWRTAVARSYPMPDNDDDGSGQGEDPDDDGRIDPVRNSRITALRVRPWAPRRDSDLRVEVRCPSPSTHATVASDAINAVGSRRGSRELGIGLDDDGYGHDTEGVPFDARLGVRDIWLRCVKVEVDDHTLVRRVRLISRLHTTLLVRRHILSKMKCGSVWFVCKKPGDPDRPRKWKNGPGHDGWKNGNGNGNGNGHKNGPRD